MKFKSGEAFFEAEGIALELKRLYDEECKGPFPYDYCRFLFAEFPTELDSLIPDLDLWMSGVLGLASHGKKLLRFSREEVHRAKDIARYSFFEVHPEYAWLKRHVSQERTPDLHECLLLCDAVREKVLAVCKLLIEETEDS